MIVYEVKAPPRNVPTAAVIASEDGDYALAIREGVLACDLDNLTAGRYYHRQH